MSTAIEAGKAFVRIFAKDETKKQLAQIGARFKTWGAAVAGVSAAAGAASAAALAGITAAVAEVVKVGSDLTDMSDRTSVATGALSELGFAAAKTGADIATLESALAVMARKTGKAGEDAFLAQAEAIAAIEDPGRRAQAAVQAFGKAGLRLLPMLSLGAKGIEELRAQGRTLGITLSGEDVKAADALGDALENLNLTFKGVMLQVGAAVAPMLKFAVDALQPVATAIVALIKENRGLVQAFAIGAVVLGGLAAAGGAVAAALFAIGGIAAGLPTIVGGIATAFGAVSAAITAILSPVGLAVAAIVAVVAGLAALSVWFVTSTEAGKAFTSFLAEGLGHLWKVASQTFKGIADALMAGNLAKAGEIAMAGLMVVWQAGIVGLRQAWASFSEFIVASLSRSVLSAAKLLDKFLSSAGVNLGLASTVGAGTGAINSMLKKGNDVALKASLAELAAAKEKLSGLSAEAAAMREASGFNAKLPAFTMPTSSDMKQLASSAAGTFSGFAASLLGRAGGASPAERTAKGVEKLVDKMDDLIDAVEDGAGVEFAGA